MSETTNPTNGHGAAANQTISGVAAGTWVSHFRLTQLLGEGGMGQVWLAEQQQPVQRQVALKLIRRQRESQLAEARFELERRMLARMDHPNIARMYEAGALANGMPWFAMEYVQGPALDDWCDDNRPSPRQVATLLCRIARGVHHAHQRSVLHRDLKPGNILIGHVDGEPVPRIIDFGVATSSSSTDDLGRGSSRAGTSAYMSPEQFAGDDTRVDTRTDAYSLGVVLLAMLLPGDGLDALGSPVPVREALHAKVGAAIAGNVSALRDVPKALLHIVKRATALEPDQRYPSAQALADDLLNFLQQRPVNAMPDSRLYRARCFIARNRLPVALSSLVAMAVLGGLGTSLWALQQANAEAKRANVVAEFTRNILTSVEPEIAQDHDTALMRSVLQDGAARADAELAAQPSALAQIQLTIAQAFLNIGDMPQGLAHAKRAYELVQSQPWDEARVTISAEYANQLDQSGQSSQALEVLDASLPQAIQALGQDHVGVLDMQHTRGWALWANGEQDQAMQLAKDSAAHAVRVLGTQHRTTLNLQKLHATTLASADRFDQAIALIAEVIEHEAKNADPKHNTRLLYHRNSQAVYHLQARRFAEGEQLLKPLLADYERVFGADNLATLSVSSNLASALRQQGKVAEAGSYYQRAADGYTAKQGIDSTGSMQTRHNYANWLLDVGRSDEALATQADIVERFTSQNGDATHPMLAEFLTGLGNAQRASGQMRQAEATLIKSVEMKKSLRGDSNSRLLGSYEALIKLYETEGKQAEAEHYRQALEQLPVAK